VYIFFFTIIYWFRAEAESKR